MSEPTEEQIKELWEWCGWMIPTSPYYHRPDGRQVKSIPSVDLHNLFQWAVPKLGEDLEIELFIPSVNWFCQIKKRTTIIATSNGYHKDPALALFWAIYKVIKEVEK